MRELKEIAEELRPKKNYNFVAKGKKIIRGVNTGRDCITIAVRKKVPLNKLKPEDIIPNVIDGVETDVIVARETIKALDMLPKGRLVEDRRGMWRPTPAGVSIAHEDVTAGSVFWFPRVNGERLVATNNHVGANSNLAKIGDLWYQPGPADGNKLPEHKHSNLVWFEPIKFWYPGPEIECSVDSDCPQGYVCIDGKCIKQEPSQCPIAACWRKMFNGPAFVFNRKTRMYAAVPVQVIIKPENLVDLAFGRALSSEYILLEVLGLGVPTGYEDAEIGDMLDGSGRTTAITEAETLMTDGVIDVMYSIGNFATFVNQLITTPTAEGGDSGSPYMKKNKKIAAIRFAGSSEYTVANHVSSLIKVGKIEEE